MVLKVNNIVLIVGNIYGFSSKQDNDQLLDSLECRLTHWLSKFPDVYFLIGGDFNVVMDEVNDRWPPGHHSNSNSTLKFLMSKFDLTDIWREKFPDGKIYTWSNKDGSRRSSLDFWLVSKSLDKNSITVDILSTPLTDYRAVTINVNFFAWWELFEKSLLLENE